MITALALIAMMMTLPLLVTLPWFGWGPGIDAAGRGMAMFFPVIAMTVRVLCLGAAVVVLAAEGGLAWSGLGAAASGALGIAFIAATGGVSFLSVSQLVEAPPPDYSAAPAWLESVALPMAVAIWMLAETYGAPDGAQLWVLRGFLIVLALSPLPFLLRNMKEREAAAAHDRSEQAAAEASAAARLDALPQDADLAQTLAFIDTIPESDWRLQEMAKQRAAALPDAPSAVMAMLASDDRAERLRAALHTVNVAMPLTPDYFAIAETEIAAIIDRLQTKAAPDAELYREGRAAIRLAWPAMHRSDLKKTQMEALRAALEAQGDGSACRALVYDAGLLAAYVNG